MIVYADLRWPDKTGIGVVKREMLRRVPKNIDVVDILVKGPVASPLSPVSISRALKKQRVRGGVFWSPGFIPPFVTAIPAVVTVHDLTHLHFYSRAHVAYYNLVLKRLYRNCASIVCVSEYTRNEFLKWSAIVEKKVQIVRNGVSDLFSDSSPNRLFPFTYIFYPGNHRPYKNTTRLLRAYWASALPSNGVHLVFTGYADSKFRADVSRLGLDKLVHFAGNLNDHEMVRAYTGALVVAFVSLYEGFGLPILEAMAAGVPVLTSNTAAMPEVAGDAAIIVDPYAIKEIAHWLEVLSFDLKVRSVQIELGKQRAKHFDWDGSAAKLWALIESLAESLDG
jgi:glycosyltransferase involved in cell wall biosynthesis